MGKNIWDEEPFRDGQPELSNGDWKEQETYTPAAENTIRAARAIQKQAAMEETEEFDLEGLTDQVANDEEDDDFEEASNDANLRIEQGKLYQKIMIHDLFEGVDADPKAVRIVQKRIRKIARELMEEMLGMRQESAANNTVVSSPFNDLEVDVLKKLASAASKGATESEEANQPVEPIASQPPKRKTLNTIGNSQRTTQPPRSKPIVKKTEPIQRQTKAKPKLNLPPEMEPDYEPLSKPIHEMTPNELAERDRQATERQKNRMVITPKSQRQEWPSYEQQVAMAQAQVTKASGGTSGISALNGRLSQLVMNSSKKS